MQVTQILGKTEYWVNFREECAVYIEKHLKEKAVAIEPVVIIPKKEELVFTSPKKVQQHIPVYNADAEFILEERALILVYEANVPYEWAVAVLKLNLRQKPFSISVIKWDTIKRTLAMLCAGEYLILKAIISHDWKISNIFGCCNRTPEKAYNSMGLLIQLNDGDKIIEVASHIIRLHNKRGTQQSYSRPHFGYHIEQVLIHDLP